MTLDNHVAGPAIRYCPGAVVIEELAPGGNAGWLGEAGLSLILVSVPSTGSEMTLFDGSKPPMLAMYSRMPALATATATVKMIIGFRMHTVCAVFLN